MVIVINASAPPQSLQNELKPEEVEQLKVGAGTSYGCWGGALWWGPMGAGGALGGVLWVLGGALGGVLWVLGGDAGCWWRGAGC